jgi:ferredoxin
VCPVEAIFAEADVPADQQKYIAENRDTAAGAPVIERKKEPLAGKTSKPCKK